MTSDLSADPFVRRSHIPHRALVAAKRAWLSVRLLLGRLQEPASLRRSVQAIRPPPPSTVEASPRELLVDVSVLAQGDAGTGIQRVTRELLGELKASPPQGYIVRTVRASRWRKYRYADEARDCSDVRAQPGDLFLGLDFSSRILPRHQSQLLEWCAAGVKLCVVMYDMLPLLRPEWFTQRNSRAYRSWLRTVVVQADSVLCISQSVAAELQAWLFAQGFTCESMPKICWFHLGTETPATPPAVAPDARIASVALRPFVLMVGTIEPRKGYPEALDAFEALWRENHPMQLVIVGRVGWKVRSLLGRLHRHPELGSRLHWFDNADDATLQALYTAARGVLVTSEAEGFGLPILEAAAYGIPLLIRDLPVFREIAGESATYFRGATPAQSADEMRRWVQDLTTGCALSSRTIPPRTWNESAKELLSHLRSLS